MKKTFLFIVLFFVISMNHLLLAQEEKPTIALVLSGGGAKGVAHIPLLQTLDSLGIVPDIIIGTSMGSVVGGFYSAGYSGDSIAQLTMSVDWSELLGGDISLRDVSMEEKSEFKRHLVDFDVVEGKPKMSSGFLKDQKLREFLWTSTYPVANVYNFDNLPIPYRAMSTDIVNGKEFMFEKGSLSLAMRASMSIPGVFEPVAYDSTLLVDGGVLNNFPVDVAKKMGYDFIIGSDVGGGMQKKDKLNSIPALLFQTGMLTSNLRNPSHQALCNILIDHVPYITYSTGDFEKSKEIYEEGKFAINDNMNALVKLADQLKNYKQREHQIPIVNEELVLDTIIYKGVSEPNFDLVRSRVNLKPDEPYSIEQITDGIQRGMGTNLFKEITFNTVVNDSELELQIDGVEHAPNVVKGSLHYDSYRGVGLMVNYTGRNILGKASRFLITGDIAEQPRFRVQYQKLFGRDKSYWWRSEVLGEFLKQKFFLQGEVVDEMNSDYYQFKNELNKNIQSQNSYVGLGLSYANTRISPETDPDLVENALGLKKYIFNSIELDVHYFYNNMNTVFFPTEGLILNGGIGRSLLHDVQLDLAFDDLQDVNGPTNGFTKFNLDYEQRWVLSEKLTGIVGANAIFIFQDELEGDELSFSEYGYGAMYGLGGVVPQARVGTFMFPGLHEDETFVTQMMRIDLGAQINPFSKFYFTPHVNIATVGFNDFDDYIDNAFSPSGNWSDGIETSSIISAGIEFAYHSFLGPVNFDVSYVNDIDKVRVFFSIGLLFNRSN